MSASKRTDALESIQFYNSKTRTSSGSVSGQHSKDLKAIGESSASCLDPDTARCLFEEGAFLMFLDVPPRTEFGIDYNSWNVGEKFKGVKMIPPGAHFVHYSSVSGDNVTSPRSGFFYNFKHKEVVVKRWDSLREGVSEVAVPEEEVERLRLNVKNLDGFLGAYPYDSYKKWISLSTWVTDKTLTRLCPTGPNSLIFSVQQLESIPHIFSRKRRASEEVKAEEESEEITEKKELPDMKVIESTRIRFCDVSSPSLLRASTPADITKLHMDKSLILEQVIDQQLDEEEQELLGEIQFAFVCFLVGQVYDAFEQWKRLIALMSRCEDAIRKRPHLFVSLIGVLYFQLREVPRDFFVDIVSRENFLTTTLGRFFSTIETMENVDAVLRRKAAQFRKHLQKTFKWDFSSEVGEDAPTVVPL